MTRLLVLFALCNLVVGTGAFVPAGILDVIAASLGVGVPAAGQVMTAYAISTALFAPMALVLTGGWPRRRALCFALLTFGVGNLACALATSLPQFTPVSAGLAVAMVEPAQRGRALSIVFLGISVSYVLGVPAGAWLGLHWGWQWPVALSGLAALAACAAVAAWVPRDIAAPAASLHGLPGLLVRPAVFWMLGLTLLYFTAINVVFAYIGPVMKALVPMGGNQLSITLMVFGLAGVGGTVLGGWANDRFGSLRSLRVQLAILATMMALVPLTQGHYPMLLAVFVAWGLAGFGMMTPQQARLAQQAPAQASVLLSLNTSMLYLGTAAGAAIGGAASVALGFERLAWVGVPFAVAGLATLWVRLGERSPASPA
jgi:MFS transporter, DHA1 family, inner membrane transport protein